MNGRGSSIKKEISCARFNSFLSSISTQVANVLRGTGNHVRLVVARAVDPSGDDQKPGLPVLPSTVLNSQKELDTHLQIAEVASKSGGSPLRSAVAPVGSAVGGPSSALANDMVLPSTVSEQVSIVQHKPSRSVDQTTSPMIEESLRGGANVTSATGSATAAVSYVHHDMPEMEQLEVDLVKDSQGLGITIAGYTCEREELSGIFVKSVNEGSAAFRSGKVAVNDQIVEVDGRSIQGYTNQQAVEMLRSTGKTVKLKLVRYVHGLKFEQLQQAIANSQSNSQATTPASAKQPPPSAAVAPPPSTMIRTDSAPTDQKDRPKAISGAEYEGDLDTKKERELIAEWSAKMGPGYKIVIAQLSKFKQTGGLGISLEGTVEKVDGEEQNPHHYIRSVLPNGPVGQNGKLQSGDELLEVNGRKLLGLYHTDVVAILKELPMNVRIICARSSSHNASVGTSSGSKPDFPMVGGSIRTASELGSLTASSASDRLFKAKSDGSISSSGTVTESVHRDAAGAETEPQSKLKSRYEIIRVSLN